MNEIKTNARYCTKVTTTKPEINVFKNRKASGGTDWREKIKANEKLNS